MQPFRTLHSHLIPIPNNDIDTDQIIPARYLKVTDKAGLAEGLFYEWRYGADGIPNPSFPLNQPEYKGAQILVAGDNFGCGSSREHAPWALVAWGVRAVVSTSFADIFRSNALKNGLLPVVVGREVQQKLLELPAANPRAEVTIDLAAQTLTFPELHSSTARAVATSVNFPIDPFSKLCLLEGVDQMGYLLKHEAQIAAFEARRSA